MSRVSRLLLAIVLFACASLAHGEQTFLSAHLSAQASGPRLVAPADDTVLRGGSFAEVRWTATQLPPAAEEWEAFLSVDGGRYYAFRITPHLDVELRHFTFAVPNVDTKRARILIRTGNEVREMHFENHGTFSIERDPNAEEPIAHLPASGLGEAAREGDPVVVSWTSGARNGAAVTQHAARPTSHPPLMWGMTNTSEASPLLLPPAAARLAALIVVRTQPSDRAPHARALHSLPKAIDLLLFCRRRNV
jgi:hypothetical protein